jgi:hypothetical protein
MRFKYLDFSMADVGSVSCKCVDLHKIDLAKQ